jgi:hypothetical protein
VYDIANLSQLLNELPAIKEHNAEQEAVEHSCIATAELLSNATLKSDSDNDSDDPTLATTKTQTNLQAVINNPPSGGRSFPAINTFLDQHDNLADTVFCGTSLPYFSTSSKDNIVFCSTYSTWKLKLWGCPWIRMLTYRLSCQTFSLPKHQCNL